ncbi:MAG: cupin domain-containing protein [Candidatus Thiodiazotropha sp. L084R]
MVRRQDRRELPSTTQIPLFELLHGNSSPQGGRLNAYIQYPEMASEKVQSDTPQAIHSGEEFIFVLSGEIQLCVADKEEILESGDGAWYLSEFVHKLRSLGDQRASVLVVTCSCAKATR